MEDFDIVFTKNIDEVFDILDGMEQELRIFNEFQNTTSSNAIVAIGKIRKLLNDVIIEKELSTQE